MTEHAGEIFLRLSVAERARIERGIFVRLDLPRSVLLTRGFVASTVLVGRTKDGVLRAYANVCRHKAIPLDARGGTDLGVMTDDGESLLCDSHGAVYEPTTGLCTLGPCVGLRLFAFDIEESGDSIRLRARP